MNGTGPNNETPGLLLVASGRRTKYLMSVCRSGATRGAAKPSVCQSGAEAMCGSSKTGTSNVVDSVSPSGFAPGAGAAGGVTCPGAVAPGVVDAVAGNTVSAELVKAGAVGVRADSTCSSGGSVTEGGEATGVWAKCRRR